MPFFELANFWADFFEKKCFRVLHALLWVKKWQKVKKLTFKSKINGVIMSANSKKVVLLQTKLDNYAFDGTE